MLFLPLALHGGDSGGHCTCWDLWVKWCGSWFWGGPSPFQGSGSTRTLEVASLPETPPPLLAAGLLVTPSLPQVSLAAFLRTTL